MLVVSALLFPSKQVCAEQSTMQTQPSDRIETIDAPRDYLSGKFVGLISNIDRFFGGDRNFQETNDSVFQLYLTKVSGYTGDRRYVLSGRAKVDLPTTEKRFHLLLETNPEKNVSGEPAQSQAELNDQVAAPESYAAALRFEKASAGLWHFSTDAGVKFKGITTNPFTRARGSYSIPIDQWRLKLTETAFWFNDIGAGESTLFEMERLLGEPLLFRSTTNATWLHEKQNFDLRQDFSIYHTLSDRAALLYQASAIGISNPQNHVTNYVALVSYRYRLHREWIYFELTPQIHFPRTENYRSKPMLVMRLEFLLDDSK